MSEGLWTSTLLRSEYDLVAHVRSGGQQLEVVFALQPLADDVHVEEAEKPAPKAEPEGLRGLRLV